MTTSNNKLTPEELEHAKISVPSLTYLADYLNYQYPTTNGDIPLRDLCHRISTFEAEGIIDAAHRLAFFTTELEHVKEQRDTLNSTIQRLEHDRLQSDRIIANEKKNSDKLFSECEELKEKLTIVRLPHPFDTIWFQVAEIRKLTCECAELRTELVSQKEMTSAQFNTAEQLRVQCSTMLAQSVTPNATVLEWIEPVIAFTRYIQANTYVLRDLQRLAEEQLSRLTTIRDGLSKNENR